ncbi:MAG: hypothetical protein HY286_12680 [Planctomycetes bacterium]|nr:hypothetical protein [Planctomycetota bacterium]
MKSTKMADGLYRNARRDDGATVYGLAGGATMQFGTIRAARFVEFMNNAG